MRRMGFMFCSTWKHGTLRATLHRSRFTVGPVATGLRFRNQVGLGTLRGKRKTAGVRLQRNAFNGETDVAQTAAGLGELITARSWLLGTLPEMLN
jgi:hypothetical protein